MTALIQAGQSLYFIIHTVQPDMVNAVGMPTTVACVHVHFSVKLSIGLLFTFFRNIFAGKIIQIDSLFE
jgi:hypothetical protein